MLAAAPVAADQSAATLPRHVHILARHNPPFVSVSPEGQLEGVVGETAAIVFKQLGWETSVTGNVPEGRLYRAQESDGAPANLVILDTFPTPERAAVGWLTRPIATEYASLIVRKADEGKYRFETPADLAGHTIAGRIGYTYPTFRLVPDLKLVRMNSNDMLLNLLLKGRVDLAVVNAISTDWQFRKAGYSGQYSYLSPALNPVPLVLSLSRRGFTEDDLKAVDAEIERFQQSDAWPKLLDRWGGKETYRLMPVM